MTDPKITVAMSVYNNAPYLAAAIESICAQSFTDFEFVIVNDGSSDASGAIIDRSAARDSRIRVIHQPNAGLVPSLNRILDEARGTLIARMDGDDIALPERFARQIAYLDAHPDVGVLGSGTLSIDEAGKPLSTQPRLPIVTTLDDLSADLRHGPPLCHPAVMMRRDLVCGVGGYHPAYRHCEDYDLWLRLAEQTRLATLPETLLLYRQSDTQVSTRHGFEQKYGAAVAWQAHVERLAGRPDPTKRLAMLPAPHELDAVFRRTGVYDQVREKVALGIVYDAPALRGIGFDLILEQVRSGGAIDGLWRTVARLVSLREPVRALRLAAALATK